MRVEELLTIFKKEAIEKIPEEVLNIDCGEWNHKTEKNFIVIRNFFIDYICDKIDIDYQLGKLDIKDIENFIRKEKLKNLK